MLVGAARRRHGRRRHRPRRRWPAGSCCVGVVLGSVLTVAYTARFVWGAFADKPGRARSRPVAPVRRRLRRRPGAARRALAGPGLPRPPDHRAARAVRRRSSPAGRPPRRADAVARPRPAAAADRAGPRRRCAAVRAARPRSPRLQCALAARLEPRAGLPRGMRGLDRTAVEVTGVVQRGSAAGLPRDHPGRRGRACPAPRCSRLAATSTSRAWDTPAQARGRRGDRRGRGDDRPLAAPAAGGAAGRRHRLRHRAAVRPARRPRPGADPGPGRDADPGGLRARAAPAAGVLHRPPADAASRYWRMALGLRGRGRRRRVHARRRQRPHRRRRSRRCCPGGGRLRRRQATSST